MTMSTSITRTAFRAASRSTTLSTTARRSYATSERPPLAHGGSNRNVIIGLTGISATGLGYFLMRETDPGKDNVMANSSSAIVNNAETIQAPSTNPRAPKTREERQKEGKHPEDMDDQYRAKFGVVHQRKRVDGPPDNRNHQEMHNRSKEHAEKQEA